MTQTHETTGGPTSEGEPAEQESLFPAPAAVEPAGPHGHDEPHERDERDQPDETEAAAGVADAVDGVGEADDGGQRDVVAGEVTAGVPPSDGAQSPSSDASDVGTSHAGEEGGADHTPSSRRVGQLEREGEVAADFLETLLDIADLDGDIEVDIDGDRAAVSVVDSEEGRVPRRLVGQQAKVLEALQELTRLAVQTATGERSRLMLDVAGHRAERRTALVALAKDAIASVKGSGERKALEDMTAFERKVVHDEVAAAGLDSQSEGVEPHRHIVILPV